MFSSYGKVPQSAGDEDEEGISEDNCVRIVFCWIFQLLVWCMAAGTICYYFIVKDKLTKSDKKNLKGLAIADGVIYFIYLCLEFTSSTSNYLCHKTSGSGMYEKMGMLYRTHPEIHFHCSCYHYETRRYTTKDSKGRRHKRTEKVRVVTHSESFSIPYYSSRDVSGLFYLNCDQANVQRKSFIKLKLFKEINFADAISYMDYEYYKSEFWRRNRFRDVRMDFSEKRIVPGLVRHNLVKISDKNPCTVNFFWYLVFTIIPLCQFYKSYVNLFCVNQSYKVRKIVSTRYDLNQPVYVEKYSRFVPQLNLISQQYDYQPTDYNYLNTAVQVNVPTEEELERAKQYANKVPDYSLSSGGGSMQAGVINDNPSFQSYDYNAPPPEFANFSGSVDLRPDQINAAGQLPPDFNNAGFQANISISTQGYSSAPNQEQGYSSAPQGQGYSSGGQIFTNAPGQEYIPPNP